MCDTDSSQHDSSQHDSSQHDSSQHDSSRHAGSSRRSVSRRSLLGAAMAGTGVALANSFGARPADASPAPSTNVRARAAAAVRDLQPLDSRLTLLGTSGGPQAEYGRVGTSSVLTVDGVNYVIDAGRSSVTQYLHAGLRFDHLRAMFITHLHADHLADYYNYFLLEGGDQNAEKDALAGPLKVFGPGPAGALPPPSHPHTPTIAPKDPTPGIKDLTLRLNQGYAYSYNVFLRDSNTTDIRLKQVIKEIDLPAVGASPVPGQTAPEMAPFFVYSDELVTVTAILVHHGDVFPCFAYRFDLYDGRSVVFSGDTTQSTNVVTLATGADVLVHEVMNYDYIVKHDPGNQLLPHLLDSHTQPFQVAEVAYAAGVPNLVLTHLVPSNPLLIPDWIWQAECSVGYFGSVHVGNDLDSIPLPAASR